MRITKIQQQVKKQDRYSVFVDEKFAFGLSENGLLTSGLYTGLELTDAELAAHRKAAGLDKAYGNALRYVAMRPRSIWELKVYLQRKELDQPACDQIIERLQKVGLLGDEAFARAWISNRRLLKNISRRKLTLELQQKRVSQDIIQKTLNEEDANDDNAALRALIDKKRARYPDNQKLMQYLARQGFSYDDITHALDSTDASS